MIDLRSLSLDEIKDLVESLGFPKYRGEQVYGWICRGKKEFRDMTNVPDSLKSALSEVAKISSMEIAGRQISKTDGTEKYLFKLEDGNYIESVFMKYKYGNTICVSSQAGCRMGCVFCASGQLGLARNLTAGEILSQVLEVEASAGELINHIVMMGTGEPLDNYENVSKFLRLINAPKGKNLSMRNITVSTCGVVPKIREFAKDFPQVNLAISLHSVDDEARSAIMPINRSYPIVTLIDACKYYVDTTGRRITFEYTLIKGVNDSEAHAEKLANLLRGINCHVNLIPLNKVVESGLGTTGRKWGEKFCQLLEAKGQVATLRRELGSDIDGACGQLRLSKAAEL